MMHIANTARRFLKIHLILAMKPPQNPTEIIQGLFSSQNTPLF